MALLGALPEASRGAEVHLTAQQAIRALLASPEVAAQRVGLQALQSLLQAAAAPGAPPAAAACGHAYTCARTLAPKPNPNPNPNPTLTLTQAPTAELAPSGEALPTGLTLTLTPNPNTNV